MVKASLNIPFAFLKIADGVWEQHLALSTHNCTNACIPQAPRVLHGCLCQSLETYAGTYLNKKVLDFMYDQIIKYTYVLLVGLTQYILLVLLLREHVSPPYAKPWVCQVVGNQLVFELEIGIHAQNEHI